MFLDCESYHNSGIRLKITFSIVQYRNREGGFFYVKTVGDIWYYKGDYIFLTGYIKGEVDGKLFYRRCYLSTIDDDTSFRNCRLYTKLYLKDNKAKKKETAIFSTVGIENRSIV